MMTPERCSSPIPESLLRQSQQRASSAGHWQNPSDPLQYLQGRSSPHSRSGSPPVTAPLRLSLQHLPGVSGGKLVAPRPTRPYTVPAKDQLADSARPSTSYSIDHLLKAGSPHGPKYSAVCRSAGSSPCQGVPASPGAAAAAFTHSPAVAQLAEQGHTHTRQPMHGLLAAAAAPAAGAASRPAAGLQPVTAASIAAVTAAVSAPAAASTAAAAPGSTPGPATWPPGRAAAGTAAMAPADHAAGTAAGHEAAAAAAREGAAAAGTAAGRPAGHAAESVAAAAEPAAGIGARCEGAIAAGHEGAVVAWAAARHEDAAAVGTAAGHAHAAAGSVSRPAAAAAAGHAAAGHAAAGHAAAAPQPAVAETGSAAAATAAAAVHAAAATAAAHAGAGQAVAAAPAAAAGHAAVGHAAAGHVAAAPQPAAATAAAAAAPQSIAVVAVPAAAASFAAAGHAAAAPQPAPAAAVRAAGGQLQQQSYTSNSITSAVSPPPAAGAAAAEDAGIDIQQQPWVDAWSSRSSVQVFSRNNALQLEAELQTLPPGQLLAAQQQHIQDWSDRQQICLPLQLQGHQQQQQQQRGDLGLDALSQQLVPWQQRISSIMQQLTQQVAFHCVEHGRTLQTLQERYAELANALFLAVSSLTQHHAALLASTQATAAALAASRSNEHGLQEQLSSVQTALQTSQEANAVLTAQHEQLQQDDQQTAQQLQQLVVSLKQQLWQARCDWEQQAAAAEAAAVTEAETASSRVAAAEEEAAGLRQRLGFVEAHLHALKLQLKQVPEVESVSVQTDLEQQTAPVAEPEAEPQQVSVEDSGGETESEDSVDEPPDSPQVVDLIDYVSRGSKRSRLWLVKVLGQITADKAVADAVADRQGVRRSSWKDFVPTWGLTRYGLQHLSDQVLGDLCASICSHAAAGVLPARWFACFCSLGPAVKPHKKQQQLWPWQLPGQAAAAPAAGTQIAFGRRGTTPTADGSSCSIGAREAEVLLGSSQAAEFWIFCACQLAYPNSVVALFPEAQEALPLVRRNLTMESLKAAFRHLGDPAGQALFVAEKLELAAVQAAEGPGAAAAAAAAALTADKGSSRPSTSSSASVLGRFGYYNAWALLDLLLAEWLSRAWARAQGMSRLRREVAGLQPPLEEQYSAALAAAEGSTPLLEKLQQAYAVLQPILGIAAPPQVPCGTSSCAAAGAAMISAEQATSSSGSDINTQLEQDAEVLLRDATAADVDAAVQALKLIASANRQ